MFPRSAARNVKIVELKKKNIFSSAVCIRVSFLWSIKLPKKSALFLIIFFLTLLIQEAHFTLGLKCEIEKRHLTIFNFPEIALEWSAFPSPLRRFAALDTYFGTFESVRARQLKSDVDDLG